MNNLLYLHNFEFDVNPSPLWLMADLRRLILPFFKSPLLQTILQRRFKYPSYWFLETRAFGARWCRVFAGPRKEIKIG